MPAIYLGTGGYEGVTSLQGRIKPILQGYCKRVEPVCLIPSLGLYQVNDGPINDITAVYSNGYPLLQLSDCDDLLGWQPTRLEVSTGGYRVDPSRGMFRLASLKIGIITVDCIGSSGEMSRGYHT